MAIVSGEYLEMTVDVLCVVVTRAVQEQTEREGVEEHGGRTSLQE